MYASVKHSIRFEKKKYCYCYWLLRCLIAIGYIYQVLLMLSHPATYHRTAFNVSKYFSFGGSNQNYRFNFNDAFNNKSKMIRFNVKIGSFRWSTYTVKHFKSKEHLARMLTFLITEYHRVPTTFKTLCDWLNSFL